MSPIKKILFYQTESIWVMKTPILGVAKRIMMKKAIGRFPNLNTFLVPYQTWEKNNYQNKIQILEVENSRLIERGKIAHSFQARRSALDDFGTKIFFHFRK